MTTGIFNVEDYIQLLLSKSKKLPSTKQDWESIELDTAMRIGQRSITIEDLELLIEDINTIISNPKAIFTYLNRYANFLSFKKNEIVLIPGIDYSFIAEKDLSPQEVVEELERVILPQATLAQNLNKVVVSKDELYVWDRDSVLKTLDIIYKLQLKQELKSLVKILTSIISIAEKKGLGIANTTLGPRLKTDEKYHPVIKNWFYHLHKHDLIGGYDQEKRIKPLSLFSSKLEFQWSGKFIWKLKTRNKKPNNKALAHMFIHFKKKFPDFLNYDLDKELVEVIERSFIDTSGAPLKNLKVSISEANKLESFKDRRVAEVCRNVELEIEQLNS